MRKWPKLVLCTGLAIVPASGVWGRAGFKGYLDPGEFDVTHALEPMPRPADPRYRTDRGIFRATRALIGTQRWAMAVSDPRTDTASLLRDFSCSVGVVLTPQIEPALVRVLERASTDTLRETAEANEVYHRRRPYTIDSGEICQPRSELYDPSARRVTYDYSSGHTTLGWTYALVPASLAPERAQRIFERGRAYGESRFVCGAHNESAIAASMLSATATMAVLATKPGYRADLAAARTELDALRANGIAPHACAAEAKLVRQRVMPRLGHDR